MRVCVAAWLAAGVLMLGCSKKKNDDCQKLVQAVGPQHAAVAAAYGRSDQTPAELEEQAVAWEKASVELAALPLESEDVKSLAGQFSSVLAKAARIRRGMAGAGLDPMAAGKVQAEAVSFMVEESKAKAALDIACR